MTLFGYFFAPILYPPITSKTHHGGSKRIMNLG